MPLTQHYRVYKGGLPHAVFRTDYLQRLRALLPSPGGSDDPSVTGYGSTPTSVRRLRRMSKPTRLFPGSAVNVPILTEQNPAEMVGEPVFDCRPPLLPVSIPLSGLSPATILGARDCTSQQQLVHILEHYGYGALWLWLYHHTPVMARVFGRLVSVCGSICKIDLCLDIFGPYNCWENLFCQQKLSKTPRSQIPDIFSVPRFQIFWASIPRFQIFWASIPWFQMLIHPPPILSQALWGSPDRGGIYNNKNKFCSYPVLDTIHGGIIQVGWYIIIWRHRHRARADYIVIVYVMLGNIKFGFSQSTNISEIWRAHLHEGPWRISPVHVGDDWMVF